LKEEREKKKKRGRRKKTVDNLRFLPLKNPYAEQEHNAALTNKQKSKTKRKPSFLYCQ